MVFDGQSVLVGEVCEPTRVRPCLWAPREAKQKSSSAHELATRFSWVGLGIYMTSRRPLEGGEAVVSFADVFSRSHSASLAALVLLVSEPGSTCSLRPAAGEGGSGRRFSGFSISPLQNGNKQTLASKALIMSLFKTPHSFFFSLSDCSQEAAVS